MLQRSEAGRQLYGEILKKKTLDESVGSTHLDHCHATTQARNALIQLLLLIFGISLHSRKAGMQLIN